MPVTFTRDTRQIRQIRSTDRVPVEEDRPRKIRKVNCGAQSDPDSLDNDFVPKREAKSELDTRADTIVAGANCRPMEWTGMKCRVSGFSDELETIEDVPIAQVATAYTNSEGETWILIINEALFFGSKLNHSLINPNQIRHFNIPVCDDPYDPNERPFGIEHPKAFIPFEMEGATIFFDTHVPTDEELATCPHIELTDGDNAWDPSAVRLGNKPTDKDAVYVRQVNTARAAASHIPETDLVLGSISESLVEQHSTVRMVSEVRVHSTANELRSAGRHSVVEPKRVMEIFNCGIDKAKKTMAVTTQFGVRQALHPIYRRYRTDHIHLHHRRLKSQFQMDWLHARHKSLSQNVGAYLITNGHFSDVYPYERNNQTNATAALKIFIDDVGAPTDLKTDRDPVFSGRDSDFVKYCRKMQISQTWSEAERSNQIWKADIEIRELKKRWQHKMMSKNVPPRLWDYGLKHQCKLMQFLPRSGLRGRTGYEEVTGSTPDISEYLDFDFYDLVYYFREKHPSPSVESRALGRWLGVAHRVGSDMCYWILTADGKVIAETTVQHVTEEDRRNPEIESRVADFNEKLNARLDETNFRLPDFSDFDLLDNWDLPADPAYGDDSSTPTDVEYGFGKSEEEDGDEDVVDFDPYIGATLTFTEDVNNGGDIATRAVVKRRATDSGGKPLGKYNKNPLLSDAQYEVEFEDGTVDKFFANVIAENLFAQCDSEGRVTFAMKEIANHRFNDNALSSDDAYYTDPRNGEKKMKLTTQGVEIEIEWNDGTTDWMPMKEVKASYPIELAEYAVANKIADKPQFRWWVPHTLRKRNRIISKVKTKYWRTTHKFGHRVPKSVEEAYAIDKENGNDEWRKALEKEMMRVKIAMAKEEKYTPAQIRANDAPEYRSFTEITAHVIFDIKMDFTKKCRFVANGSRTDVPEAVTYSSVVDRDSVRLAFLIAAINGLEVSSCDIGNAYLNAECREKIWFEAGPELGEDMGCVMRITRALYGLRSSGAAWRSMFSDFIVNQLGFTSTIVDGDVYRKKNFKSNGQAYYELLLCYVDDVLLISHAPSQVMEQIKANYRLKDDSYGPPKTYLGAEIEKFTIHEEGKPDVEAWSFMSEKYVKNAVETVEGMLREDGRELKTNWSARKFSGPLPHKYRPELDMTELCSPDHASRFRQIVGILRWAVELGRLDILIHVALMSQYQAAPRMGHLEALYMIVHYLKRHPKKRLVFDPTIPDIDWERAEDEAKREDWFEFYGDIEEEDPRGMPEPLGEAVRTSCFVDADHAGNKVTRRSHTGIFLFVNNAMIQAFSKKQNTVESATFGSELVALRIARDMIVALRIKLKMFGVPIIGDTLVMCDNNGVVQNTSKPHSTLNKKHNSINYHIIREAVAQGILRVRKEDTETNLADVLTKILPYDRACQLLRFLYDY